jgi:hypothetical protein
MKLKAMRLFDMKSIIAITLFAVTLARAEVTTVSILPSATDDAIKTYDFPYTLYVNRNIVVENQKELPHDRHELLLFIPGTHAKDTPHRGPGPAAFCTLAADLGYHVISLTYPDQIPASICRGDKDERAFEEFRMAIIQGGHTKYISVEPGESIEHRVVMLLKHLKTIRPKEHWEQFLTEEGTINWKLIAVSGHSQGGGHVALLGIKHRVARVLCFGAPKDYSHRYSKPAAWYALRSATPRDRFFTFNHHQDFTGDTSPEQLMENVKALKLDTFGSAVEVDETEFPYHHSRMLFTRFPTVTVTGPQSEGSLTAHGAMLNNKNAERWKQVWTYMLTEGHAKKP